MACTACRAGSLLGFGKGVASSKSFVKNNLTGFGSSSISFPIYQLCNGVSSSHVAFSSGNLFSSTSIIVSKFDRFQIFSSNTNGNAEISGEQISQLIFFLLLENVSVRV